MSGFGEVLILAGSLLVAISAVGLHRFDSVFARLHAAGKATSLGFLLVAGGALTTELPARTAGELALAGLLLVLTTPVGVHMLARAAYRSGDQLAPDTAVDELAEALASRAAGSGRADGGEGPGVVLLGPELGVEDLPDDAVGIDDVGDPTR